MSEDAGRVDKAASLNARSDRGSHKRSARRWIKASLRPGLDGDPYQLGVGDRQQHQGVTLASLLGNPTRASEVPVQDIPALVAQLAAEQATLSAVQGALTARLLASQTEPKLETPDRLLTASEVAEMLGMTKRWVQRRARRLPFARKLSDRAVRYSETGLRRWMINRKIREA